MTTQYIGRGDLADYIRQTLGDHADDFDLKALIDAIDQRFDIFGLHDVSILPGPDRVQQWIGARIDDSDVYWQIVQLHDRSS
jgi:hypothetical protein